MPLYGLRNDGDIFDLFTDQTEAEFALLDIAADEPDLAIGRDVVELDVRVRRVVRRSV
jgi:hypothetical protein